jgi:uncharacterized protein involved in tellurium resistance
MKKKIIGIFVCILLISTAIPSVESLKNNVINKKVTNSPLTSTVDYWIEIQKLLALDGVANDRFGWSVSLSGDTALIGAPFDDDNGVLSGSAYVFIRNGTTWTQQAKLLANDNGTDDRFGQSVSLSGDTALIGAYYDSDNGVRAGAVYVFTRTGATWTQQEKLFASDGASQDNFGFSVSLYDDTALIGTNYDEDNGFNSGSAYIFTRNGTIWTQQAKLLPSDGAAEDNFGYSVSLYGDTAFIGAVGDDDKGFGSGSIYVYIRNGSAWTQQAKLFASDETAYEDFGCSISLDGSTAIIGALGDDVNDVNSGSAYVFIRTGTNWTQQAKLIASDGARADYFGDYFGWAVSLSKDTALISAYCDNVGKGSVYVFIRNGTTWTQQAKLYASDGAEVDWFGWSVSLSENTSMIGAYGNGGDKGSAYAFTRDNGAVEINITSGLGMKVMITNMGTEPYNYLSWELNVYGGILGHINKKTNGNINIPQGKTSTIRTGLFFGFGPIIFTARIADVKKIAEGKQFIFFSMVQ